MSEMLLKALFDKAHQVHAFPEQRKAWLALCEYAIETYDMPRPYNPPSRFVRSRPQPPRDPYAWVDPFAPVSPPPPL